VISSHCLLGERKGTQSVKTGFKTHWDTVMVVNVSRWGTARSTLIQ